MAEWMTQCTGQSLENMVLNGWNKSTEPEKFLRIE
jgi:hypothetical protein